METKLLKQFLELISKCPKKLPIYQLQPSLYTGRKNLISEILHENGQNILFRIFRDCTFASCKCFNKLNKSKKLLKLKQILTLFLENISN